MQSPLIEEQSNDVAIEAKGSIAETFVDIIDKYSWIIVLFWIGITILCSFWALDLTNHTSAQFSPPPGSESAKALHQMKYYFPELSETDIEIIFIKQKNNSKSIINSMTKNLCQQINTSIINKINPENEHMIQKIDSYYQFSLFEMKLPLIKHKFVDKNENVMLLFLTLNVKTSAKMITDTITHLQTLLKDVCKSKKYNNQYDIVLTGSGAMGVDVHNTIHKDITSKDLYFLPLIFAFMIYMLGSWKLIVMPLVSLIMSIIISFTVYLPFAKYNIVSVSMTAPNLMMFLTMALSTDYSLFLLSRFSSERKLNNSSIKMAVQQMINYSGHIVFISAIVLTVCFLGLILFPVADIQSIAYGATISIFMCMAINITFSAAVILTFPSFFGKINCKKHYPSKKCKAVQLDQNFDVLFDKDKDEKVDNVNNAEVPIRSMVTNKHNVYFKLANYITMKPYNYILLLIVYCTMGMVIYFGFANFNLSMNQLQMYPASSPAVNAYKTITTQFTKGALNPIDILVINNNKLHQKNIWNIQYFNATCNLGKELITNFGFNATQLTSATFFPNILHSEEKKRKNELICFRNQEMINIYHQAIESGKLPLNITKKYPFITSEMVKQFFESMNNTISNDQNASIITISPNFDTFTVAGQTKADKVRHFVKKLSNKEIALYMGSMVYATMDTKDYLYARLPWCLCIIVAVIFILIGFVFGAIILPFRLLISVVIPVVFDFAVTALVYDDGGVCWLVPPITMSVLIGISLDYEIFLFSTVHEYRNKGYSLQWSIISAITRSGPVITTAGLIMSSAFAGLLIEDVVIANQMGFVFFFSVIMDTVIVKPIIEPALLSIFGDTLNWWPKRMPNRNLSLDNQ